MQTISLPKTGIRQMHPVIMTTLWIGETVAGSRRGWNTLLLGLIQTSNLLPRKTPNTKQSMPLIVRLCRGLVHGQTLSF